MANNNKPFIMYSPKGFSLAITAMLAALISYLCTNDKLRGLLSACTPYIGVGIGYITQNMLCNKAKKSWEQSLNDTNVSINALAGKRRKTKDENDELNSLKDKRVGIENEIKRINERINMIRGI